MCRFCHRQDAADDAETAAIEAAAAVQEAAKSKATKAAQEARAAKAAESSSLYSRAASFDGYLTTIILGLFDKPPLEALKQVWIKTGLTDCQGMVFDAWSRFF